MPRSSATLALALALLGCPRPAPPVEPAAPVTSSTPAAAEAPAPVRADEAVLSTSLAPGVVLDEATGRVFLMGEAGIVAVEAATGESLWQSSRAIKPLALVGTRLLAIGADNTHAGIAVLDAATGAVAAECAETAPPGTSFPVMEGLGVNVSSHGLWVDGRPVLTWTRSTHYAGGAYPTEEVLRASQSRATGSVVVDPATGCATAAHTPVQRVPPMFPLHGVAGRYGPWTWGELQVFLESRDHDDGRAVVLHRERGGVAVAPEIELGRAPIGTAYSAHGRDWRTLLLTGQRRLTDGSYAYDARHIALESAEARDFPGLPWVPVGFALVGETLVVAGPGAVGGHTGDALAWTVPLRQTGYTGPYPP